MLRYRVVYRRRRRRASAASARKFAFYKEEARALVHALIAEVNAHYGYPIKKIFIKNSRSRWGSCSQLGNLNFNYRIVLLSPHLARYVVAHELCHLAQLNHSAAFWALVAQTTPQYKEARRQLRRVALR